MVSSQLASDPGDDAVISSENYVSETPTTLEDSGYDNITIVENSSENSDARPTIDYRSTSTSTSSSSTSSSVSISSIIKPILENPFKVQRRDPTDKWKFNLDGTSVTLDLQAGSSTTLEPQCGGSPNICLVDFRLEGVGDPQCCDATNNDGCADCLEKCKVICISRRVGVSSCFMDGSVPQCRCTRKLPECYHLEPPAKTTTTTMQPSVVPSDERGNSSWITYFLLLGFLGVVLVWSVDFVHRADRE